MNKYTKNQVFKIGFVIGVFTALIMTSCVVLLLGAFYG